MPFTYLPHQVPALAIKMAAPGRVDGTALALGSMSPDWAFALVGSRFALNAHVFPGLLTFCVPVTVVVCWLLRRTAPGVFACLPSLGPLRLSDYRLLGSRSPGLTTTAGSAFLGALTHVGWDLFTHPGRWGTRRVPWLRDSHEVFGHLMSGASIAQYASSVLGGAVALLLLVTIARRRALPTWYGGLPATGVPGRRTRLVFLAAVAVGAAVGTIWALPVAHGAAAIIRGSAGIGAGAFVGGAIATHQLAARPDDRAARPGHSSVIS